jgi:hypothetical protein
LPSFRGTRWGILSFFLLQKLELEKGPNRSHSSATKDGKYIATLRLVCVPRNWDLTNFCRLETATLPQDDLRQLGVSTETLGWIG